MFAASQSWRSVPGTEADWQKAREKQAARISKDARNKDLDLTTKEGTNMSQTTDAAAVAVRLTWVQRKLAAELLPKLADRLLLDSRNQRTLPLSKGEATELRGQAEQAIRDAETGTKRNSFRHMIEAVNRGIEQTTAKSNPGSGEIFRFKITLLDFKPLIWRSIEVPDGTLDALHEHIQAAMGWTNSHLHEFVIDDTRFGDPDLLDDGWGDVDFIDSTNIHLSVILAKVRKPFHFRYQYDFGDSWEHKVVFERCATAESGTKYPRCLEGARACPPEDVGGVWGYAEFLDTIKNPKHEEHESMLEWIGGSFDPEKFSSAVATKEMRRGLPNWRDNR